MRAFPGRLAVRAEAADEESLQRIKDLLAARLQKFGGRERLKPLRQLGSIRVLEGPDRQGHRTLRVRRAC